MRGNEFSLSKLSKRFFFPFNFQDISRILAWYFFPFNLQCSEDVSIVCVLKPEVSAISTAGILTFLLLLFVLQWVQLVKASVKQRWVWGSARRLSIAGTTGNCQQAESKFTLGKITTEIWVNEKLWKWREEDVLPPGG